MSALPASHAKSCDCLAEDIEAFVKLIGGNELTPAMRDADVARAKDDGVGAERDHARSLGAESPPAPGVARCPFQKLNQSPLRGRFATFLRPRPPQLTN